MNAQTKYWYWLGVLTGIGAKRAKQLLDIYGNAYEVFRQPKEAFTAYDFLSDIHVAQLSNPTLRTGIEDILNELAGSGVGVVSMDDARYPELLLEIDDPPPVLFYRGALPAARGDRRIAIVGTRRPTAYGITMTRKITAGLAGLGFTIVSGLAAGIDAIAHKAALDAGAKTIAVLGCGVDRAYPYENRRLMDAVIEAGSVYSEYPPGSAPFQQNFPRRNRLICGMSIGIVVIEAGERSGALITAGYAGEQGRDIFAVPGNATSPMSKGANALLRDGAALVTSAEDIAFALNKYLCPSEISLFDIQEYKRAESERRLAALNPEELKIARCLQERGPQDIDGIAGFCRLQAGAAASAAVMLELKEIIRRQADGTYDFCDA